MLRVRERLSPERRCAICHGPVGLPRSACASCRAVFHEDCLVALGRCSTLACREKVTRTVHVRLRERRLVRITAALAILGAPVLVGTVAVVSRALVETRKMSRPPPIRSFVVSGTPSATDDHELDYGMLSELDNTKLFDGFFSNASVFGLQSPHGTEFLWFALPTEKFPESD